MDTLLKILRVFAIILVIAAVLLIAYDYASTRNAFPPGTYISGMDVSLLSPDEALKKIKKTPIAEIFIPHLTLGADDKTFSYTPEELGVYILCAETIDKAFALTHGGTYLQQLLIRMRVSEMNAPLVLEIKDSKLKAVLETLAEKIHTEPKDASMTYYEKTGGYNIKTEEPGRKLNVNRSLVRFKIRLYQGEKAIPLVLDRPLPKISEKELRQHPPAHKLASYTTYYGKHNDWGRIHNIKLVASWIDGTILMPGDGFSVEEILGDVTEEQGFKKAYVIMKDELVKELGGGSCQIATTLFNAVTLADLKIIQRRNHSFYFAIYPLGRDATVYPGSADFEFENDSGYPVMIKAKATNRWLSFRVYGTPSGKKVKFRGLGILGKDEESGKFVPMSLRKVIDTDVPFKTFVTRVVYDKAGKIIKEEVLRSSYKLYGDKENVPIRRDS